MEPRAVKTLNSAKGQGARKSPFFLDGTYHRCPKNFHFDVVIPMIADTLYNMPAQKFRGFEDCDAPKYTGFLLTQRRR